MKLRTDNEATGYMGRPHDREPRAEAEHFVQCPICKQMIDMRDLGQVLHHADEAASELKARSPRLWRRARARSGSGPDLQQAAEGSVPTAHRKIIRTF
ncbi:MAG: hypothetical protein E5X89_17615 [Mesorhizobium sp.]|nr:MAG: hypothetical protein E5X88_00765 [Mesorhizobium sp.]TIO32799.1 MAG: hypothetical protein E5X89_17615 [Mesorhizobium sp.]TIP13975.1 MAG: hypothetical protein E5X73_03490 [Mesorhizobium sp.]TIP14861.1 MAG: hypothetical protein E5X73_02445 [Mesorhizobium sp.]